jgi:hypothetical protein
MHIIDGKKCGMRIHFSSSIVKEVGLSDTAEITLYDKGVIIGNKLPFEAITVTLKPQKNGSAIVYCSALVRAMQKHFQLNMTTYTSQGISSHKVIKQDGCTFAYIYNKED